MVTQVNESDAVSASGAVPPKAGKIGISDLLFLAYHAMKREAAGQPVKPIDIWCDTVANVIVDEANPKATDLEASGE